MFLRPNTIYPAGSTSTDIIRDPLDISACTRRIHQYDAPADEYFFFNIYMVRVCMAAG